MERIAPSARLEAQIEQLLGDELAANGEKLSELGRLGARLVLQRAVEDEVTAFLGRARYERAPEAAGSRNGTRPKRVQTAEGEISVDMPQVRGAAAAFAHVEDLCLGVHALLRRLDPERQTPGGRHARSAHPGWPVAERSLTATRCVVGPQ